MLYERISALLPRGLLQRFKKEMNYLGINVSERSFVGFLFIFGLALSIGIALNIYAFLGITLLSIIPIYCVFVGGVYLWLSMAAESKGRFVEKILPDALQLIASNVKSGLTTERALFVSARPEFGPLADELKLASKRIMAGERVEKVLMDLPKKIRSKTLERTVWLLGKGIQSGGQMAGLLLKLSDDLREEQAIQAEQKSNVSMYVMLIFFSAAFGAPLLFGVSSFIVEILHSQMANIPTIQAGTVGIAQSRNIAALAQGKTQLISVEFVMLFSSLMIFFGGIFSSLTMGVINNGREKMGVKYIPIMIIIGFAIFFAVRIGLGMMFGKLLL